MYEDYQYVNMPRLVFGDSGATFIRVCYNCGRFVKADQCIYVNDSGLKDAPNAYCSKCGRTKMLFEGFM